MNSRIQNPPALPRGFFSALALFATVLIAITASARAAVSTYTDLALFNSALTPAGLSGTSYGFITSPGGVGDPDSLTTGPASLTGQNPDNGAGFFLSDDYGISGAFYSHQLSSQNEGNGLVITFDAPVLGFAFDSNTWNFFLGSELNPNDWPTSGATAMTLTTNTGEVLDLFTSAYAGFDPAPSRFNGIVSSTEFSSVTLSIPQGQNFQITGFTVAAIPEPSTYAVCFGVTTLAFVTWRRIGNRRTRAVMAIPTNQQTIG